MQIELARRVDAPIIAALSRDLIETGLGWSWRPERVLRSIRDRETTAIKLVEHDRISGFAVMRFGIDEAHLDLLAVRAGRRRRGIGSALLRWLEQSALTAGTSIVRLEVRQSNAGGLRFYERMGYRPCRTLPGYYQGREAAVQMARDLWCDIPINAT